MAGCERAVQPNACKGSKMRKNKIGLQTVIALILGMSASLSAIKAATESDLVYIGTYTGEKSKGIYLAHFDRKTGQLTEPELAAETKNPSFLAIHPNHRFLYAVGEFDSFQGKAGGAVSAFSIDSKTGKLTLLNQQPSEGTAPCHLALDRSGKCVLVANYSSGSIAALPVEADGKLKSASAIVQHKGSSVDRSRQEGPHAHFITMVPQTEVAVTCDLGLDQVLLYDLDAVNGSLKAHMPAFASVKAGSGPRHLAFHPSGKWVYVINEMGSSITAFEV